MGSILHTVFFTLISPQVVVLWEPQDGITVQDIGVGFKIEHVLKENCLLPCLRQKIEGRSICFSRYFQSYVHWMIRSGNAQYKKWFLCFVFWGGCSARCDTRNARSFCACICSYCHSTKKKKTPKAINNTRISDILFPWGWNFSKKMKYILLCLKCFFKLCASFGKKKKKKSICFS